MSVDIYLQGFILQISVAEAICALKRYHNHSSGAWYPDESTSSLQRIAIKSSVCSH